MTRDDTLARVRRTIAFAHGMEDGEWTDSDYDETYNVIDDLGFSSLEFVDFILALEKAFAIEISDEDADEVVEMTIGEIVDWLMEVVK